LAVFHVQLYRHSENAACLVDVLDRQPGAVDRVHAGFGGLPGDLCHQADLDRAGGVNA